MLLVPLGGDQAWGLGGVEGAGQGHGALRLLEEESQAGTTVGMLERSLFVLYLFMFSSTNVRRTTLLSFFVLDSSMSKH